MAQTPSVKFVYPGAEHSRFSHSVGVMHLAGRLAETLLTKSPDIGPWLVKKFHDIVREGPNSFPKLSKLSEDLIDVAKKVQTVRLAGLLHDVGHAPFSHSLEPILDKRQGMTHEDITVLILKNNDEIKKKIAESEMARFLGITMDDIIAVLKRKAKILSEIITGPFSVDDIDYLTRDAYFCGATEYGSLDYERLIDTMMEYAGALIPDSSALHSVLEFWEAQIHMFSVVYYHRAARAVDLMLYHMVDGFLSDYEKLEERERPKTILSAFLDVKNVDSYLALDDGTVISELVRLKREGSNFDKAFRLLEMYLRRELLTCFDEKEIVEEDEETYQELTSEKFLQVRAKEIAELAGIDESEVFADVPRKVRIKVNPVFGRIERMQVYDKREKKPKNINEFPHIRVAPLSPYRGIRRLYTFEEHEEKVKKALQTLEKNR